MDNLEKKLDELVDFRSLLLFFNNNEKTLDRAMSNLARFINLSTRYDLMNRHLYDVYQQEMRDIANLQKTMQPSNQAIGSKQLLAIEDYLSYKGLIQNKPYRQTVEFNATQRRRPTAAHILNTFLKS